MARLQERCVPSGFPWIISRFQHLDRSPPKVLHLGAGNNEEFFADRAVIHMNKKGQNMSTLRGGLALKASSVFLAMALAGCLGGGDGGATGDSTGGGTTTVAIGGKVADRGGAANPDSWLSEFSASMGDGNRLPRSRSNEKTPS